MNLLPVDPGPKLPKVCVLLSKFYVVLFIEERLVLGSAYVALKELSLERPDHRTDSFLPISGAYDCLAALVGVMG